MMMPRIKRAPTKEPKKQTYLGEFVRRRREELGLSQAKLAAITGLDRGYITNVEGGLQESLSVDRAAKLADALKVSVDSFVSGRRASSNWVDSMEAMLVDMQNNLRHLPIAEIPIRGEVPHRDPLPPVGTGAKRLPITKAELEMLGVTVEVVYALTVGHDESVQGLGINPGEHAIINPNDCRVVTGKVYEVKMSDDWYTLARLIVEVDEIYRVAGVGTIVTQDQVQGRLVGVAPAIRIY